MTARTLALVSIILLSSIALQLPIYDKWCSFNDEGYVFNTAEEVMHGEVLYRDKPGYIFPGIIYFLAFLYKVFGISFVISRIAMAAVFSATSVLVFFLCREFIKETTAFAAAMIFALHKAWAFPIWHMIGYTTFCIFFLSLAVYFIFLFNSKGSLKYIFLSGTFTAVAILFRQDFAGAGAIVFLIFFLLTPAIRAKSPDQFQRNIPLFKIVLLFTGSIALVLTPVLLYFAVKGALPDMFINTFWIPLTAETKRNSTPLIPLTPFFQKDPFFRTNLFYYLPGGQIEKIITLGRWPFILEHTALWDMLTKLVHYSPYATLLVVCGILINCYRKRNFTKEMRDLIVIFLFSCSLIATQHKPYDFSHLMQMYLPTMILLVFLLEKLFIKLASRKTIYYLSLLFVLFLGIIYSWESIRMTYVLSRRNNTRLEGPRANIYLKQGEAEVWAQSLQYIQEVTGPDEPIFVFPYHSLFYFLSQRKNPTKYDILWEIRTYSSTDQDILNSLEQEQVEYLVYSPTQPADWGIVEEFAPELMRQIRNRYSNVRIFGTPERGLCFIVMQRKHEQLSENQL